ncbi:hypothetical protein VNO77_19812 [Canavalia gladiata]|uniref:Uncharacterized protein n=1 Tax=Canavalia gladiata TaxID=3824 RepID=A0AAN9LP23_CANGL
MNGLGFSTLSRLENNEVPIPVSTPPVDSVFDVEFKKELSPCPSCLIFELCVDCVKILYMAGPGHISSLNGRLCPPWSLS